MVDRDLVASKLAELSEHVARVRQHRKPTAEALRRDRDARDLVAFNLMLAVQACVDIASHVIADERWLPATTLAASFERLEEHGVVTPSVRAELVRAVGLRNVIAHGYAAVRPDAVHAASVSGVDDLDAFARQIAAWIAGRAD